MSDAENAPEFNHSEKTSQYATVPYDLAGQRFDQIVAKIFSEYSRARLQTWIKSGKILVNGEQLKPREKLHGGEKIELHVEADVIVHTEAQAVDLPIIYEDQSVLIINKPAGLVVHPGAGNADQTLMNGLLHYCPELEQVPRAGIVHRLDKDTTGLMVVAKTLQAHTHLVAEMQQRLIKREYLAICRGVPTSGGKINQPIGRHPNQRTRMAVNESGLAKSKPAVTHYRVIQKFGRHSLLRCKLETGRTHQIRVHLAWRGYGLVGDQTYGGRLQVPKGAGKALGEALRNFKRQALHATQLGFMHPDKNKFYQWQIPLPRDFQGLLDALANDMTEVRR
jgi:23S rRNA pseudouridine1911/1915/1917 synthase